MIFALRVMAAGVIVFAAVSGAASAQTDLAEVRRWINAGEPQKAIAHLQAIKGSSAAAEDLQVALLLGVAYYHASEPLKAVEALAPIVDRLPVESIERREAEQVLGLSSLLLGRFAEAIPRLEATRRWAPDNLELAYALSQAYLQTQRNEQARTVLASLFKVGPESAAAHLVTAHADAQRNFQFAAKIRF